MASTSSSGRGEQEHRSPLDHNKSSITSPLTAKQFYVFINHRGPDVKETLARKLYDSLMEVGISAYLDSQETELGDYFPSAIRNAIFSARVHIAILSPRYVESAWCLAELALMFQTKARIIPLFYRVDPSDFRHIKGSVADEFSKHEAKGRYPSQDIQRWKDCLRNVSGIKGSEFKAHNESSWNSIMENMITLLYNCIGIRFSRLTGSDQNVLCNEVVSAVVKEKQKRKIPIQVAKYEVGLNETAEDFYSHYQKNVQMRDKTVGIYGMGGSDKTVGIYGMGGSGKTTLAKYLFNRESSEFSASTFLFDVRGKHVKGETISMQSQLLKDLFSLEGKTIHSIEDGIAAIKDNLERNRELTFLIVVDNIYALEQLDALVHMDALSPNSLVIITTRDERLLTQAGVRVHYKIKEMKPEHSRELFCCHAFHRKSCKRGFEHLVDNFVNLCKGLPLALQVMGAHVCGGDKNYWKLQLDHFKVTQHKGIRDTLKISYDALDEDEKEIFMDIACFFLGENVSNAISIWKASGWKAEHALQTLKDKCLVEIESIPVGMQGVCAADMIANYETLLFLRMHDHLRDLGREIADAEMSHPRRLWHPEDLIRISEIEGLQDILLRAGGERFRCYGDSNDSESNLHMRYFLESSAGASTELRWLDLSLRIPEWIPLQNLHTLNLQGESPWRLWRSDNQDPLKLIELRSFFRPHFLDFSRDESMRDLNELVRSFGMFKNLETLQLDFNVFEGNIEWNSLLKSLRELSNLKTLQLESFSLEGGFSLRNSTETTDGRFCMESLEAITLCRALKTRSVSVSGHFCPTLKSLKLYSLDDLIEVELTGVTTLECLVLLRCKELTKILANDLLQLEIFRAKYCPAVKELPNFGRASFLKRIYISHCRNIGDISAIESLKGLKRIWVAYCPELKNIKAIEQLNGLRRIWINKCIELQGTICLKELKALKSVFIGSCPRLQNIEGIGFLKYLESIVINACPHLEQQVPGIEKLEGLKEMIIADSPIISCAESLQKWPWELAIIMGRTAMSDKIAEEDGLKLTSFMSDLIGPGTLCVVDEIDCSRDYPCGWEGVEEQVKEMIRSFQRSQHSDEKVQESKDLISCGRLSTFIFIAMVDGSPGIASAFCDGSRDEPSSSSPFADRQRKMYVCVVNEERVSDYDSWMPSRHMWSDCSVKKAAFMGVKEGEERKVLQVLKSLFAQPCVVNSEYYEYHKENWVWLKKKVVHSEDHGYDEEKEDGSSEDHDNKHAIIAWMNKPNWWREPFAGYNEEGAIWRDYEVDQFDIDDESDEEYYGQDDNDS